MKPTKIELVKLSNPKSAILGFAKVTFDDMLVVKNIKVIRGEKGLFIGMPATKGKDEKYYDDVFVIDSKKKGTPGNEFFNRLQSAIVNKWNENNKPEFEDQTSSNRGGPACTDGCPF